MAECCWIKSILGECMALWGEPVWFDHLHASEYTDKQCSLNTWLLVTISIHSVQSMQYILLGSSVNHVLMEGVCLYILKL